MKKMVVLLLASFLFSAAARADFVILRDGRSYSGVYTGARTGKIAFTDTTGIQYSFPLSQVQSLVFSNVSDHVALRSGQSYTGQLTGVTSLKFRGSNGVGYVFPLRDVASLVITPGSRNSASSAPSASAPSASAYGTPAATQQAAAVAPVPAVAPMPQNMAQETPSVVIASGTRIAIRTDMAIDTSKDQIGKLYPARVAMDVADGSGAVAIPAGTQAELEVIDMSQDGEARNSDLALALHSVTLNGTVYRVDSSSVTANQSAGYGLNKRTAEYSGGGAVLGTVMGALFGGGEGAGIGALAGGGAGAVTQFFTRGKRVHIPAEATLTFQLERTLVLHP